MNTAIFILIPARAADHPPRGPPSAGLDALVGSSCVEATLSGEHSGASRREPRASAGSLAREAETAGQAPVDSAGRFR